MTLKSKPVLKSALNDSVKLHYNQTAFMSFREGDSNMTHVFFFYLKK